MAEIRATPQQRAAAEDRGGALLVAAAAGSGKTKVLVDRLMGYLTDPTDPADLDEFLIITYTRAAASELRGKIATRIAEALARHAERPAFAAAADARVSRADLDGAQLLSGRPAAVCGRGESACRFPRGGRAAGGGSACADASGRALRAVCKA